MRTVPCLALLLALAAAAPGCPRCRPAVRRTVYSAAFAPTLGEVLSPMAVLALGAVVAGRLQRPGAR